MSSFPLSAKVPVQARPPFTTVSGLMVFDAINVKEQSPQVSEACLHASSMILSMQCLSMLMLLVKRISSGTPATGGTAAGSATISGITV
jgi:hypothetical protein